VRITTKHFVLLVAAREPAGGPMTPSSRPQSERYARLGLIVSRRIGGAVARNRVKRLCRECFRLFPELLPGEVDLVVVARHGADSMKLQEVRAEWERVVGPLRRGAALALARRPEQPHVSAGKQPAR
jgi:ribonuclease P protein component